MGLHRLLLDWELSSQRSEMDAAKGGRSNHPGPRLKSEISRGISHSEISKLTDESNCKIKRWRKIRGFFSDLNRLGLLIIFIISYDNSWKRAKKGLFIGKYRESYTFLALKLVVHPSVYFTLAEVCLPPASSLARLIELNYSGPLLAWQLWLLNPIPPLLVPYYPYL